MKETDLIKNLTPLPVNRGETKEVDEKLILEILAVQKIKELHGVAEKYDDFIREVQLWMKEKQLPNWKSYASELFPRN